MEYQQQPASSEAARPLLEGWLSRAEIAAELGVSTDTLARWKTHRIGPPCVRVGRKVLYRAESFRDWLVNREATLARPKRETR